jgi:hypothetical protein
VARRTRPIIATRKIPSKAIPEKAIPTKAPPKRVRQVQQNEVARRTRPIIATRKIPSKAIPEKAIPTKAPPKRVRMVQKDWVQKINNRACPNEKEEMGTGYIDQKKKGDESKTRGGLAPTLIY